MRQFDPASQRSLGEVREAIVIRTRLVPPIALKDDKVRERVALRASEIGLVRKELAELSDSLTNGPVVPRCRAADSAAVRRARSTPSSATCPPVRWPG